VWGEVGGGEGGGGGGAGPDEANDRAGGVDARMGADAPDEPFKGRGVPAAVAPEVHDQPVARVLSQYRERPGGKPLESVIVDALVVFQVNGMTDADHTQQGGAGPLPSFAGVIPRE